VTFDGKTYGLSAFNSTGADYAEMFEWLDGNPDNEDRIGYFVSLNGDKIVKATEVDTYILGVISATPSVIGDSYEDDWSEKYMTDKWGRIQYEDKLIPAIHNDEYDIPERTDRIPILNPNWNPEQEYIPREKRKEWACVGMMGKMRVYDDGTCLVNGFCKQNNNGIATKNDFGFKVLKRISDNIIQILIK
jgi:hypothetical protein